LSQLLSTKIVLIEFKNRRKHSKSQEKTFFTARMDRKKLPYWKRRKLLEREKLLQSKQYEGVNGEKRR
jgi:hypothetical protein